MHRRTDRLNSLLKEVISEVISQDVRNPAIAKFLTVTNVNITPDLRFAKVSIGIIGKEEDKDKTIKALNSASGFIASHASKKVVMRYFPNLTFQLDTSVDKHMEIEKILSEIKKKKDE